MKKLLLVVLFLFLIGCESTINPEKYTITFVANNEIVLTAFVSEGEEVSFPTAPVIEGYTFSHWDNDLTNVSSDLIVTAIYTMNEVFYKIRFMADDKLISEFEVKDGEGVTAPKVPIKEGYNFIGWDKSFHVIKEDLTINAIYEKKIYYEVIFIDGDTILSQQSVLKGDSANAPIPPVKDGYLFIGWSIGFTNVQCDLTVTPLYEKIIIPPVEKRVNYSSYKDAFTYSTIQSPKNLVNQVVNDSNLKATINPVYNGGFRNTNYTVYYDASNIIKRNQYGFEIAINSDGIVIDKSTLVSLPIGGFIISAHGTGIDKIKNINIGDVIKYNVGDLTIKAYSSRAIGLYIKIENIIPRIEEAMAKLLALDYQGIEQKVNEAINIYHQILQNYNITLVNKCDELLLEAEFMLVEGQAVQTKAYWHYPTKNKNYPENNQQAVEAILDKIKEMGFNNIYLNTNMDGKSIYKSKYLQQKITNNNQYGNYKDYLECFITEAHKRGLKVTAWANTLIAGDGSPNAFYDKWLLKGINYDNNQGGMYFVDISNPEVQTFLNNVYRELASEYLLDGIEFDFIRFPHGNLSSKKGDISNQKDLIDWGYTDTFIEGFRKVNSFTGDFKTIVLKDETFRNKWLDYKRSVLNKTVEDLVTTIRSARPSITMCSAVMSSITGARNTYLQDWLYWVEQGWIDVLDPMIYNADNEYVLGQVKNMMGLVEGKAQIVAGLFPETNGGLTSANAQQIALISEHYQVGWAKFSSRVIFANSSLMSGFKQMNRIYTVTEQASKNEVFNAYIYDLLDKVDNFYQFADKNTNYKTLLTILENAYLNKDTELETRNTFIKNIETELNNIGNQTIKTKLLAKLHDINNFLN